MSHVEIHPKRLLEAIPTLLVLITVSFFMMRFAPGNPFTSERALPPEVLANIEANMALDKPIGMQHLTYLGNLVQGICSLLQTQGLHRQRSGEPWPCLSPPR